MRFSRRAEGLVRARRAAFFLWEGGAACFFCAPAHAADRSPSAPGNGVKGRMEKREWGRCPGVFRGIRGEFSGEDSHFFPRFAGSIGRPRSAFFPGRFPGNVVPGVMFFMKVRAVWPERTPAVCPGRVLQAEKAGRREKCTAGGRRWYGCIFSFETTARRMPGRSRPA